MKKIILFINCLVTAALANAQQPSFEWAKNIGGYDGFASGNSIALDASMNVYAIGNFAGTIDFDPGPGVFYLTSGGTNTDVFISKTDASGNFVWAKQLKQLGGTSTEKGYSVKIDGSGNIYITGNFVGTVDFDPGAGSFNLTSAGSWDIFISKLNSSGNFVWVKQIGGTNGELATSVALDASGNIYATGSFGGTVDFDPGAGTFNLTASVAADIFILQLDGSGNFVWVKQIEASAILEQAFSIALDGSGNIYTAGSFQGTSDFDPGAGTFNLTTAGSNDIFILKLNAAGNFVWAKQMGGPSDDIGFSIAVDGSGNVYTTGYFSLTADFDPGAGTFNLTSLGIRDIFISKLDASGNFAWAKRIGGSDYDEGKSIIIDASGNVCTTGYFGLTVDFDPGAGTFNLSCFGLDIFILKLDASGNFVWAKQLGGPSPDVGYSIAVDGPGNVYTTGYFQKTADFDPGTATFYLTSPGSLGTFVSKLTGAGNFVWACGAGSSPTIFSNSIAVDLSGNIYTTGYFNGMADFDPGAGTFYLTSAYGNDIFISKLDASGNFVWAKQMGGISDDRSFSIALDGSGNVYTTGYFSGTADFDPGPGTYNLTSVGSRDIFITKLNSSGNFVWAKRMGGISSQINSGTSIALDGPGNVYTTGYFYNTVDFDPGAGIFNLNSSGSSDVFVSKLDASGNFVWAKQMGRYSADEGYSVAVDGSGNVYTSGNFKDTSDFDPDAGIFNLISKGDYDIFISKLNSSGNFVWAKRIGGTGLESGRSMVIDGSGNVYTTGDFDGTADFDPDLAITFNLTPASASDPDIFVSKLDASGNFVWAKQMGGTSEDIAYSIAVDGTGNVYTTGYFTGTADFDPGTGTFNLTNGRIFISKLDVSGNFVWAKQMWGSTSDYGSSIDVDAVGNIYTTGSFWLTTDFDPGAGIFNLTAFGNPDIFIHKMSQCTPPSAAITPAGPTTFCSGGSVVLNAPTGANKSYQWKKGANLISGATLSSYTATTGGNYKVIVTNTVTGCSKTTASATVATVNALPSATITPQGPTTFCAGGSVVLAANAGAGLTYKWKKGSNFISGATLSNYTATVGGNYKVQVTNSNGCSKTSTGVVVSVPCKEGESENPDSHRERKWESGMNVSVFPNPNSGEFTIKFSTKPTSPIQIELTDEIGKVVKRFEANDETVVIKESNLANGIYCLTVRNKDEVVVKKINVVK